MSKNTEVKATEGDVAVLAKQKSTLLYQFYETIKNGGDILSAEDLDIAIESLKLAQLDIKDREERSARNVRQNCSKREWRKPRNAAVWLK